MGSSGVLAYRYYYKKTIAKEYTYNGERVFDVQTWKPASEEEKRIVGDYSDDVVYVTFKDHEDSEKRRNPRPLSLLKEVVPPTEKTSTPGKNNGAGKHKRRGTKGGSSKRQPVIPTIPPTATNSGAL